MRIAQINIPVADLDEADAFYQDFFGLTEIVGGVDRSKERRYQISDGELRLLLSDDEDEHFGYSFGLLVDDIAELYSLASARQCVAKAGDHDLVWKETDGTMRVLLQGPSGKFVDAAPTSGQSNLSFRTDFRSHIGTSRLRDHGSKYEC
jgi:catechol 2,3-dioxygenase-like lactoylglutathione lyase family enzyme